MDDQESETLAPVLEYPQKEGANNSAQPQEQHSEPKPSESNNVEGKGDAESARDEACSETQVQSIESKHYNECEQTEKEGGDHKPKAEKDASSQNGSYAEAVKSIGPPQIEQKPRIIVKHGILGNRIPSHDPNVLVESTTFTSIGKIQPFLITISTNAALVMDFHCHLTSSEVVGYLAGNWDVNSHNLNITHAFPCKCRLGDFESAPSVESEIKKVIKSNRLTLVGWYHSHPTAPAAPSLRDIDTQLDYELRMKGNSDSTYLPCVGIICSPYNLDNPSFESNIVSYWVIPPPENKIHEYGKPMMMSYSVLQDRSISHEVLLEMKKCADFYKPDKDFIKFDEILKGSVTYLDKLKASLSSKFPLNHQKGDALWNYLEGIVALSNANSETETLRQIIDISSVPGATTTANSDKPKFGIPSAASSATFKSSPGPAVDVNNTTGISSAGGGGGSGSSSSGGGGGGGCSISISSSSISNSSGGTTTNGSNNSNTGSVISISGAGSSGEGGGSGGGGGGDAGSGSNSSNNGGGGGGGSSSNSSSSGSSNNNSSSNSSSHSNNSNNNNSTSSNSSNGNGGSCSSSSLPYQKSHSRSKSSSGKRPSSRDKNLASLGSYFVGSDLASALFGSGKFPMGLDPATKSLLNLNSLSLGNMFLPPMAAYKPEPSMGLMKPPPPPPPSSYFPYSTSRSSAASSRSSPSSSRSQSRNLPSTSRDMPPPNKVPKVDVHQMANFFIPPNLGKNCTITSRPSTSTK